MRTDKNQPILLERWIRGRVDVHFRSGHIANLAMSLDGAHAFRKQVDDEQGSESVDALESHEGWVSYRSEEVVLTEWTPDPEYGWRDTSSENRARLRTLGMRHGVLHALADLWSEPGREPSYSIAAIAVLFTLATSENMTRDQWDRAARLVEGTDGAQLLETLLIDHAEPAPGQARRDVEPDDRAQPDDAHTEDPGKAETHANTATETPHPDAHPSPTDPPGRPTDPDAESRADDH